MYKNTPTHKASPEEFLTSLNEEIIKYLWSLEDKHLALNLLNIQYAILSLKKDLTNKIK